MAHAIPLTAVPIYQALAAKSLVRQIRLGLRLFVPPELGECVSAEAFVHVSKILLLVKFDRAIEVFENFPVECCVNVEFKQPLDGVYDLIDATSRDYLGEIKVLGTSVALFDTP